jgi:hypothetical protein
MAPGRVLLHPNFVFSDGKVGRKLVVLLSDSRRGYYLAIKTTSNDHRYNVSAACQVTDRYPNYFVPKHAGIFDEHTWLQMEEFFCFPSGELERRVARNDIYPITTLNTQTLPVLACARDSDDLLAVHRSLIVEIISDIKSII